MVVIFAILSPADLDGMVLPPLPSPVMDTIKRSLTTEPLPPTAPSSTTTEAIINATTTGLTALPGITLPTLALPLKLYPHPHHRWSTGFFLIFFKKVFYVRFLAAAMELLMEQGSQIYSCLFP